MSRGLKGREVIAPPQPAQLQSPSNRFFSPGTIGVASANPSSAGIGSPATPASKGISSGISPATEAGSGDVVLLLIPLLLLQQSLQVKPFSLLGSNGSSVIVPPHALHFQFP